MKTLRDRIDEEAEIWAGEPARILALLGQFFAASRYSGRATVRVAGQFRECEHVTDAFLSDGTDLVRRLAVVKLALQYAGQPLAALEATIQRAEDEVQWRLTDEELTQDELGGDFLNGKDVP